MSNFFFKNPVGQFLFDVVAGGVIGAGVALMGLNDAVGISDAGAVVMTAFTNGCRSAAKTALIAVIRTLQTRQ